MPYTMPSFQPPNLPPRDYSAYSAIPRSIDALFNSYMQGRMGAQQRRQSDQAMALQQLQVATQYPGLDINTLNSKQIAQAARPAPIAPEPGMGMGMFSNPGQPVQEDPNVMALRQAFDLHRQGKVGQQHKSALELENLEADTLNKRSNAAKNQALAQGVGHGSMENFYTDPETGMRFRIKPGHKGNEMIPLPGQAIGSDGKVVFTSGKEGGKLLPPSAITQLNEGKAVAMMLPEVEAALNQAGQIMGPAMGRIGSGNPYDKEAQTTDAQFRATSQAFGKFMEGGVLRKEDEEKYRKMFPQLSDLPEVARKKLSIVGRMLAKKYEADRIALGKSGYDVSGFDALPVPGSIFDGRSAEDIRAQYQAGKITKDQARAQIQALGGFRAR